MDGADSSRLRGRDCPLSEIHRADGRRHARVRLSADGRRPEDVRAHSILPVARRKKSFRNRRQLLRVFAWNARHYDMDNGALVARFGVPGRSDEERRNLALMRKLFIGLFLFFPGAAYGQPSVVEAETQRLVFQVSPMT